MAAVGREEAVERHVHPRRVRQEGVLGGRGQFRLRGSVREDRGLRADQGGSFRRCLLAGPIKAVTLAVAVDAKTGMLNLREEANNRTKGEVVRSCSLKAIGVLPEAGNGAIQGSASTIDSAAVPTACRNDHSPTRGKPGRIAAQIACGGGHRFYQCQGGEYHEPSCLLITQSAPDGGLQRGPARNYNNPAGP
jgi:hypothetical protein